MDEQALTEDTRPDLVPSLDQKPVDIIEPASLKKILPLVGAENTANTKVKQRRLVVCIDGTSNQFSDKSTNVIELYSHIKKDGSQLTYYNSGIGTYANPSWYSFAHMKQAFDNQIDLMIAWNLEKVIMGAYRWLSDTYQPGDDVFLFGFSRGAYQVRALAAMINSVGLLYAGNQEQIPFAWELYAKGDHQDKKSLNTFKKAFSQESFNIHFIGAWDTVSSVGIIRKKLLPGVEACEGVTRFRHALALDERRVKFLPEYVTCEPDLGDEPEKDEKKEKFQRIKEVWFAGTHSDDNPDLARAAEPLMWMMGEAKQAGLVLNSFVPQVNIKGAEVTESLRGPWHALEYIPFSRPLYRSNGITRQAYH
ncbi:hypothetical protein BDV93DRAFT_576847 [Ceratobasidium sp. AG-I]|nr:hypothetical protein BDV93DRAFT_576847 [Ceratobasidium sp. AG-I]